MEAEQRAKYIGRLIKFKVGTNRIECNQVKSRGELRKDSGRRVKEIIDELRIKSSDAQREAHKARFERNENRKKLETDLPGGKNATRRLIARFQGNADMLRKTIQKKNEDSIKWKVKKWGSEETTSKPNLSEDPAVSKYKDLGVFNEGYGNDVEDDVFVNVIGDVVLNDDERLLLKNSPKLAITSQIDEEQVERELEIACMKTRWDYKSSPGEYNVEEDKVSEESKELENLTRQVFNHEKKVLDFSSSKATDSKLNTHVHIPRAAPLKFETEIQMRKTR